MKRSIYLGCLVVVTLLGSCSPVRVFLEKDQVSAAREYETFAVVNEVEGKYAYGSPQLDSLLRKQVIEGMQEQGYVLDSLSPDLVVRYNTILTQNQKEINTMAHNPWGWGMYNPWMWRYPYSSMYNRGAYKTEKYLLGEIVMDFVDREQGETILRLSAVGEVDKPKQMIKNVETSANRIVKEFNKRVN